MDCDTLPKEDACEEHTAPAEVESTGTPQTTDPDHGPVRSTLASLLGLSDEELAEPVSRVAPPEHRWEQLTLGDASDAGHDAPPTGIRSGAASQPPTAEQELIPGLDAPGAVEVPVYLAGRALRELLGQQEENATPVRPPAIKVEGVGRQRKAMPAPSANFGKAEHASVLWPKPGLRTKAGGGRTAECGDCGAPVRGGRCVACGAEIAPLARRRRRSGTGRWRAMIDSDLRILRTFATLVSVPGELTRAFLAGHKRRYLSPATLSLLALLLFAVVSTIGSLRPRPDRTLSIGIDRTGAHPAGLADPSPVNLAVDSPRDLLRDFATALDYVPLLWFPLMAFGVVAVAATARLSERRDDNAEIVFAAHFASWFVLCWGLLVPAVLLLAKLGFESAAAWDGVLRVRELENGRLAGVSRLWNDLRQLTISRHFHSALLAVCLVPWATVAWRRVFATPWAKAFGMGVLIAAVPLLLLVPFA